MYHVTANDDNLLNSYKRLFTQRCRIFCYSNFYEYLSDNNRRLFIVYLYSSFYPHISHVFLRYSIYYQQVYVKYTAFSTGYSHFTLVMHNCIQKNIKSSTKLCITIGIIFFYFPIPCLTIVNFMAV